MQNSRLLPMNPTSPRLVISAVFAAAICTCAAEPTALEQYMLELINRARADGNAEAARAGLALQEGNPAIFGETWIIQPVAPPLVWNEQLTTAARNQAQSLLAAGFLSGNPHIFGGTSPEQRIAAAGFSNCLSCPRPTTASGYVPGVENIGFAARTTPYSAADLQTETGVLHRQLFADGTSGGRPHRITIMYPWYREIGLGLASGTIAVGGSIYFMMDFGRASPGNRIYLTGVVYNDNATADQFYTPGEGLGSLKVEAWQGGTKVAETNTWASGGYRLPLAAGTWQIKLVNAQGNVADMGSATLTSENVKRDSRNPSFTAPPAGIVNLRIARSGGNAVILQWDDPSYALAAADKLTGPWTVVAPISPATLTLQPGSRFFRGQR
jgi:hypothetical protein